MAVKKVLGVKNPKLRKVSRPVEKVDKRVKNLIRDLEDTLKAQKKPPGVGLAAPQIGVSLRVFVLRNKGKIIPIINPETVKLSRKTNDPPEEEDGKWKMENGRSDEQREYVMEGCLSLPHYYGPVRRAAWVELKYQALKKMENPRPELGSKAGKWKMENVHQTFRGFPAQIIQHEIDHLNGKLFIDRLLQQKRQLYKLEKGHWHKVELP